MKESGFIFLERIVTAYLVEPYMRKPEFQTIGIWISVWLLLFVLPLSVYPQFLGTPAKPETVQQFMTAAVALEKEGKLQEAIAAYSDLLRIAPENEQALEARAALYLRTNESDNAIADYSALIAKRPKAYAYWYNRSLGHRQKKNFVDAIDDLSRALALNSKDDRVLTTRANTFLDMDDIPRATVDIDLSFKEFGPTAKTNIAKSVLCSKTFETDCLISASEQAARMDPYSSAAFNNLGYGLILKGDLDTAMRALDKAEQLAPTWSFPPNNKALIYILKKRWKEAAEQIDKAKSKNPVVAELFNNQGLMEFGKGNLAEALRSFDRAIEMNPKLASSYLYRGRVRYAQQEYLRSLDDVNLAFTLNPRSAESLLLRAEIQIKLGKAEEAKIDREVAIRLRSTFPIAEIRNNQ